jgi:hypothetical protein
MVLEANIQGPSVLGTLSETNNRALRQSNAWSILGKANFGIITCRNALLSS